MSTLVLLIALGSSTPDFTPLHDRLAARTAPLRGEIADNPDGGKKKKKKKKNGEETEED